MSRLPTPGQDNGNWGEILNDFLGQSHNADGSLKEAAIPKSTDVTTDGSSDTKVPSVKAVKTYTDSKVGEVNTQLAANATHCENLVNAISNMRDTNYANVQNKLASFITHYNAKDKDMCVLLLGDSIIARHQHTTMYTDDEIAHRPPLCDSKNLCGLLWDKINWGTTQYRRFDALDGGVKVFTETDTPFLSVYTSNYDAIDATHNLGWTDIVARNDVTRFIGGVGLKKTVFKALVNVRRLNFVYRAGPNCAQTVRVDVFSTGRVQVYDEASSMWVEAKDYTFSMYDTKNVYQKRLKFRFYDGADFDSRSLEKNIGIVRDAGVPGLLTYWGIEYTTEEFMFSIINSARGAHSLAALREFIEEDVFDRQPDLLLFQIPIMNMGCQYQQADDPSVNVAEVDAFMLDAEDANSLISRWTNFDTHNVLCWLPHFSIDANGIDQNTGAWKRWTPSNNTAYGEVDQRDYYHAFNDYFDTAKVPFINLFDKSLIDGMDIDKNLYNAFAGSGISGLTFTNDGTHQNNTGTKLLKKGLFPVFDF